MSVLQSGNITPGHIAAWATDGVIQDGGSPIMATKVLGTMRGANFAITTDQPIIIPQIVLAYVITAIIITNAPTSLSGAIGGFYTAAGKGGTAVVAASQTYSSLTGPTLLLYATLNTGIANTRFAGANTLYLSLSNTAVITPAFGDVYIIGTDLT